MANVKKQLAELRAEILQRELGIKRIKNAKAREKAYEEFRPLKKELMAQIKKINDRIDAHILTMDVAARPFRYGKVMMVEHTKGTEAKPGNTLERLPLKIGQEYDPTQSFMGHQISEWTNRKLGRWTWMDFTTDDPEALKTVLLEGYGEFKCLFADWRDRKGKAILVHNDAPIDSLLDMGVITRLDNMTQTMKTAKYLHRLFADGDGKFAPKYGKEQEGSWEERTKEFIVEFENGETLIVRFVDLDSLSPEAKANVDGHIDLSLKAHRVLGLANNPKVGQSWSVTVHTKLFGKGHTRYIPHLDADIVIYGPKKLVGADNGEFAFMSLGVKHGTSPNSDIQSVTNFKLYKLLLKKFHQYCKLVYLAAHDENALTKLVLSTIRTGEQEDIVMSFDEKDTFILRKALTRNISPFVFPGLYRRAYRFLMGSVANVAKWRVPLEIDSDPYTTDKDGNLVRYNVAMSRYASGEPAVINPDGTVDMSKSKIKKGQICIPDLPEGIDVIIYRQPNENPNAWYKLRNVHIPEYMEAAGEAVCFLGEDSLEVLGRLGGGDMDDNLIIIHDPEWVAHFDTLSYEEAGKIVAEAEDTLFAGSYDSSNWEARNPDIITYGLKEMENQIDIASKSGLSIGSTVNADLDDLLKSDPVHKASMIAWLKEHANTWRDEDDQFLNAAKWLADERPDHITSFLAANLELIIDAAVKDPSLMRALNRHAEEVNPDPNPEEFGVSGFISAYHRVQRVYPYCMRNRIPASKVKAGGYVLAYTEQCRAMDVMLDIQSKLEQKFVRNEWRLVNKADQQIADMMSPKDQRITELVSGVKGQEDRIGLRRTWTLLWQQHAISQLDADDRYDAVMNEFGRIIGEFGNDLGAISVELYRQLYAKMNSTPPPPDYNGRIQNYPDGLMWTNAIGNALLNMLHRFKYTGAVINARIFIEKQYGNGTHSVRIANGIVYVKIQGEEVAIGEVNPRVPAGIYQMDDGLIVVRQAHPAFQPKNTVLTIIEPLF